MANNYTLQDSAIKGFSSYAGADIVAAINLPSSDGKQRVPMALATLSDITYSTHRPKYEVLALGSNASRGFTSGPRVVAGQLIFVMFDSHLMYDIASNYADSSSVADNNDYSDIGSIYAEMKDRHEDELPLFDIVINCANQDGFMSHMIIYGVQLVDSQSGFGISSPVSDIAYTYVAIDYKPITPGAFTVGKTQNIWTDNSKANEQFVDPYRIESNYGPI